MKNLNNKKIWIPVSFACIILGMVILVAGRALGGVPGFYIDNNGIHYAGESLPAASDKSTRDSKELEPFDRLEINVDFADVQIISSDRFAIDYHITREPVCEVRNGTLIFRESDTYQFTPFHIGFFTSSFGVMTDESHYYVRLEIPADYKFTEASINIDSGTLDISTLQADTLKIKNEYGDVSLNQYNGKNMDIHMDSGSLFIDSMNALQAELENEYGDVKISRATGEHLTIDMDSCNCRIDYTDYSDIKITDEYGDVSLGLTGNIEDYNMNLYTEYGDIRVENERLGYGDDDEMTYRTSGKGKKKVAVSCDTGNIEINSK